MSQKLTKQDILDKIVALVEEIQNRVGVKYDVSYADRTDMYGSVQDKACYLVYISEQGYLKDNYLIKVSHGYEFWYYKDGRGF